jgi:hypothetical protein
LAYASTASYTATTVGGRFRRTWQRSPVPQAWRCPLREKERLHSGHVQVVGMAWILLAFAARLSFRFGFRSSEGRPIVESLSARAGRGDARGEIVENRASGSNALESEHRGST